MINATELFNHVSSFDNKHVPLHECTEFMLHVKFRFAQNKEIEKIIDYAEHRLKHLVRGLVGVQKLLLITMLDDYVSGNIACAWHKGKPVYVSVIHESA